jgi:hypothetical protein
VLGAQAFGKQTESMTFAGATGAGFYRPTFTVDGSLYNVGRTESDLEFFYSTDSGPAFLSFRIQNSRGHVTYYGPSGAVASFPGMSLTGDLATGQTISGTTQFTLNIPIAFGTPTDITFGLWAGILPSSSVGLLTPSAGDTDFLGTVKLTGITVTDAGGNPIDDFGIVAGSGTRYGRFGVVNVPEPATYVAMLFGLLGVVALRLKPHSHRLRV